jgi:hypothetical protein
MDNTMAKSIKRLFYENRTVQNSQLYPLGLRDTPDGLGHLPAGEVAFHEALPLGRIMTLQTPSPL